MSPVLLAEFTLGIDIDSFLAIFWHDNFFYESFLTEKLLDLSVNIGEWSTTSNIRSRNIRSYHPSKISFPGLASHAEVLTIFILASNSTQHIHNTQLIMLFSLYFSL